ncbi:MAG: glycosyltransferase family 4 protein [Vicinamibacterales bacterium]
MRIALVVHDFNRTFGHGRYVVELASRYADAHDVHVFSNTYVNGPDRIRWHHVPAFRLSALSTIVSFYPAATLALRGSFDIVHAQGFSVAGANVVTAHISQSRWLAARRALCGGRLPWRERLFGSVVMPLERRALGSPTATVIAVSEALKHDIVDQGSSSNIVVIPHGVDAGQFNLGVRARYRATARLEFGCSGDDEPLFLFVGDLRKGFAHAVAALRLSVGRLVAVSRSDPSEMLALARSLGVADRVQIQPATTHIERCYAAADVFVFPTQYDAFGMVITEAMACGLPVITTSAAGAAELIEHGRTGFVMSDPADEAALASCMRVLAADPGLRQAIGDAAADAMETHSWDNVASQTLAVYRQVASTPSPARA